MLIMSHNVISGAHFQHSSTLDLQLGNNNNNCIFSKISRVRNLTKECVDWNHSPLQLDCKEKIVCQKIGFSES